MKDPRNDELYRSLSGDDEPAPDLLTARTGVPGGLLLDRLLFDKGYSVTMFMSKHGWSCRVFAGGERNGPSSRGATKREALFEAACAAMGIGDREKHAMDKCL